MTEMSAPKDLMEDEVKEKIKEVIKRDQEMKIVQFKQLEKLKKNIVAMESFLVGWEKMKEVHNGKTCCLCGDNFGWVINRGDECPSCNRKVCNSCRREDVSEEEFYLNQKNDTWHCELCYDKKQYQLLYSLWQRSQQIFYADPEVGDINNNIHIQNSNNVQIKNNDIHNHNREDSYDTVDENNNDKFYSLSSESDVDVIYNKNLKYTSLALNSNKKKHITNSRSSNKESLNSDSDNDTIPSKSNNSSVSTNPTFSPISRNLSEEEGRQLVMDLLLKSSKKVEKSEEVVIKMKTPTKEEESLRKTTFIKKGKDILDDDFDVVSDVFESSESGPEELEVARFKRKLKEEKRHQLKEHKIHVLEQVKKLRSSPIRTNSPLSPVGTLADQLVSSDDEVDELDLLEKHDQEYKLLKKHYHEQLQKEKEMEQLLRTSSDFRGTETEQKSHQENIKNLLATYMQKKEENIKRLKHLKSQKHHLFEAQNKKLFADDSKAVHKHNEVFDSDFDMLSAVEEIGETEDEKDSKLLINKNIDNNSRTNITNNLEKEKLEVSKLEAEFTELNAKQTMIHLMRQHIHKPQDDEYARKTKQIKENLLNTLEMRKRQKIKEQNEENHETSRRKISGDNSEIEEKRRKNDFVDGSSQRIGSSSEIVTRENNSENVQHWVSSSSSYFDAVEIPLSSLEYQYFENSEKSYKKLGIRSISQENLHFPKLKHEKLNFTPNTSEQQNKSSDSSTAKSSLAETNAPSIQVTSQTQFSSTVHVKSEASPNQDSSTTILPPQNSEISLQPEINKHNHIEKVSTETNDEILKDSHPLKEDLYYSTTKVIILSQESSESYHSTTEPAPHTKSPVPGTLKILQKKPQSNKKINLSTSSKVKVFKRNSSEKFYDRGSVSNENTIQNNTDISPQVSIETDLERNRNSSESYFETFSHGNGNKEITVDEFSARNHFTNEVDVLLNDENDQHFSNFKKDIQVSSNFNENIQTVTDLNENKENERKSTNDRFVPFESFFESNEEIYPNRETQDLTSFNTNISVKEDIVFDKTNDSTRFEYDDNVFENDNVMTINSCKEFFKNNSQDESSDYEQKINANNDQNITLKSNIDYFKNETYDVEQKEEKLSLDVKKQSLINSENLTEKSPEIIIVEDSKTNEIKIKSILKTKKETQPRVTTKSFEEYSGNLQENDSVVVHNFDQVENNYKNLNEVLNVVENVQSSTETNQNKDKIGETFESSLNLYEKQHEQQAELESHKLMYQQQIKEQQKKLLAELMKEDEKEKHKKNKKIEKEHNFHMQQKLLDLQNEKELLKQKKQHELLETKHYAFIQQELQKEHEEKRFQKEKKKHETLELQHDFHIQQALLDQQEQKELLKQKKQEYLLEIQHGAYHQNFITEQENAKQSQKERIQTENKKKQHQIHQQQQLILEQQRKQLLNQQKREEMLDKQHQLFQEQLLFEQLKEKQAKNKRQQQTSVNSHYEYISQDDYEKEFTQEFKENHRLDNGSFEDVHLFQQKNDYKNRKEERLVGDKNEQQPWLVQTLKVSQNSQQEDDNASFNFERNSVKNKVEKMQKEFSTEQLNQQHNYGINNINLTSYKKQYTHEKELVTDDLTSEESENENYDFFFGSPHYMTNKNSESKKTENIQVNILEEKQFQNVDNKDDSDKILKQNISMPLTPPTPYQTPLPYQVGYREADDQQKTIVINNETSFATSKHLSSSSDSFCSLQDQTLSNEIKSQINNTSYETKRKDLTLEQEIKYDETAEISDEKSKIHYPIIVKNDIKKDISDTIMSHENETGLNTLVTENKSTMLTDYETSLSGSFPERGVIVHEVEVEHKLQENFDKEYEIIDEYNAQQKKDINFHQIKHAPDEDILIDESNELKEEKVVMRSRNSSVNDDDRRNGKIMSDYDDAYFLDTDDKIMEEEMTLGTLNQIEGHKEDKDIIIYDKIIEYFEGRESRLMVWQKREVDQLRMRQKERLEKYLDDLADYMMKKEEEGTAEDVDMDALQSMIDKQQDEELHDLKQQHLQEIDDLQAQKKAVFESFEDYKKDKNNEDNLFHKNIEEEKMARERNEDLLSAKEEMNMDVVIGAIIADAIEAIHVKKQKKKEKMEKKVKEVKFKEDMEKKAKLDNMAENLTDTIIKEILSSLRKQQEEKDRHNSAKSYYSNNYYYSDKEQFRSMMGNVLERVSSAKDRIKSNSLSDSETEENKDSPKMMKEKIVDGQNDKNYKQYYYCSYVTDVNSDDEKNGKLDPSDIPSTSGLGDVSSETRSSGILVNGKEVGGPDDTRKKIKQLSYETESEDAVFESQPLKKADSVMLLAGEVKFGLYYNTNDNVLEIHIYNCNLGASNRIKSNPYIKTYLMPDKSKKGKRKTKVKKNTNTPEFNEVLKYNINQSELKNRILSLTVWNDSFMKNTFLGEVVMPLDKVSFNSPVGVWNSLQQGFGDQRWKSILELNPDANLEFSMIFDTSENEMCLKVNILQARSLSSFSENGQCNAFATCILKKSKIAKVKRKTRIMKNTIHPLWNEEIRFTINSKSELENSQLEISIWNHEKFFSNEFLGGIRLSKKDEDEKELWLRMFSNHNLWIPANLPLRPSMEN